MRVFFNVPAKKAKIDEESDILQPSQSHHSCAKVLLVSLIINFMWGERRNLEINKTETLN